LKGKVERSDFKSSEYVNNTSVVEILGKVAVLI